MIRIISCILVSFILTGCNFTADQNKAVSEENITESNELVVISLHKAKYPVKIFGNRGFLEFPESQEKIITDADTFKLKLSGNEFIYFSHKNTQIDTVLVSSGDTLKLYPKDNYIESSVVRLDRTFENFLQGFDEFKQRKGNQRIRKSIDSLKSIFYRVDNSGIPFVSGDEYTKYISYPLHVNRKAFSEDPKTLENLLMLLKKQFFEHKEYIHRSKVSLLLTKNIEFLEQYRLFNELSLLKNISNDKTVLSLINSDLFLNNDLQFSPFAKSIIGYILAVNFVKKETGSSASKNYWDWKPAYDKAPSLMNDSLAKYARFLSIERMIGFGEPIDDIEQKYNDFKRHYKDETINRYLDKKYIFDLNALRQINKDVAMISFNRKSYLLDDLIKKNKGKLVYIDFWASWCGPCRKVMPASRKLMSQYPKDEIAFFYISIDKDMDKWQKAASTEELENYPNSYLVLNTEASDFLKKIKLTEIPRYLLFDKSGKLIHQNAYGPESQSIRDLFDQNL